MGIHITEDDFNGRRIGSACGQEAWALAQRYFDGTARADIDFPGFVVVVYDSELRGSTADRVLKRGRKLVMHIRRSTALKVGVASVLAVGAFGPDRQRHDRATRHRCRW